MSKPIGRYIKVKPHLEDKVGSIIIPINAADKAFLKGTVVEIGETQDAEIKPGDEILFSNIKQYEDEEGNWIVAYDKILYIL